MLGCLTFVILSFATVDVAPAFDFEAGDTTTARGELSPAPQDHAPGASFNFDDDPFDDDDNDSEKNVTARLICRGAPIPVAVADPKRTLQHEPLLDLSNAQALRLHLRI